MTAVNLSLYPETAAERDRWILSQRPERRILDPRQPYAFLVEEECAASGEVVPVATIFLTNRECPWRCLMCDLWRNTLTESVPSGAIPEQIGFALSRLPAARHIKLYNSGSFFDVHAIPPEDYGAIAAQIAPFERVIVESHPSLVGDRCFHFRDLLSAPLEVAMGLETVHPIALERLNKRMTLKQFADAGERLRENAIDLRVFILVQPPFVRKDEALYWAQRSLDYAFDCGATAATLIPTRAGNGATDHLMQSGDFAPPDLQTVEEALEYGIGTKRGRVFVDLWDIRQVAACSNCREQRIARLAKMNHSQLPGDAVLCDACGGRS
jgi:radical SAM enzyme (TIGR01210 family)